MKDAPDLDAQASRVVTSSAYLRASVRVAAASALLMTLPTYVLCLVLSTSRLNDVGYPLGALQGFLITISFLAGTTSGLAIMPLATSAFLHDSALSKHISVWRTIRSALASYPRQMRWWGFYAATFAERNGSSLRWEKFRDRHGLRVASLRTASIFVPHLLLEGLSPLEAILRSARLVESLVPDPVLAPQNTSHVRPLSVLPGLGILVSGIVLYGLTFSPWCFFLVVTGVCLLLGAAVSTRFSAVLLDAASYNLARGLPPGPFAPSDLLRRLSFQQYPL